MYTIQIQILRLFSMILTAFSRCGSIYILNLRSTNKYNACENQIPFPMVDHIKKGKIFYIISLVVCKKYFKSPVNETSTTKNFISYSILVIPYNLLQSQKLVDRF